MPYNAATLPFPPHWINGYIWDKIKEYDDVIGQSYLDDPDTSEIDESKFVPFVFATPTNFEEIWNYIGDGPILVNCERMMRYRTGPFYPIKREQLAWYVRFNDPEKMINFTNLVFNALDREDASAADVNQWAKEKQDGPDPLRVSPTDPTSDPLPYNVYFHRIKVFVIDESRDVTEIGTAKTYVNNKIIIEYDYHPIQDPSGEDFR